MSAKLYTITDDFCRTYLEGGGLHESPILAGYYVFNADISFTFQAIKNLSAH